MNEVQTIAPVAPPKPKILLVDDDAAMLSSLRLLLKANGHSVESAQGGAKALELLQAANYDLMLLDLQMPGVGGHEVLGAVDLLDPHDAGVASSMNRVRLRNSPNTPGISGPIRG